MTNESKTLDELNKIEGAFDRGNMYKCTYTAFGTYTRGDTYPCNGEGIVDEFDDGSMTSVCHSGDGVSFILVASLKEEEFPQVGDTIQVGNLTKAKYMYIGDSSSGSAVCESLQARNLGEIKKFHHKDLRPATIFTSEQEQAYKLYKVLINKEPRTIDQCVEEGDLVYLSAVKAVEAGWICKED